MKTLRFIVILTLIFSLGSCKFFKQKKMFSKDVDTLTTFVKEMVDTPPVDTFEVETIIQETEPVKVEPSGPGYGYTNDKFYMIVGSFFSEQLANKYANKMYKMGYSPLVIYSASNQFYRVAAKSYNDYNTAINDISTFRNNVTPRAWVHVKRN